MTDYAIMDITENRIVSVDNLVTVNGKTIASEGDNLFYNEAKAQAVRQDLESKNRDLTVVSVEEM